MLRPNILFILVDSAKAEAFSMNGGPARTPNIDRLAREGVRFTHSFTTAPICHPSRTSLLTGLHPRGHGIITNTTVGGWYPFTLHNGVRSLADSLSDAGYRCGYAGQWHVHGVTGFHDSTATTYQAYAERLRTRGIAVKQTAQHRGCATLSIGIDDTREAEYANETMGLIDTYASQDAPWFIECDFDTPHPPCNIPAPYDTMYDPAAMKIPPNLHDDMLDKPRAVRISRERQGVASWTDDDWRRLQAYYYGNITMVDDLVGRILTKLETSGCAENTIVVFTSDHGGMVGAHGIYMHGCPALYDEPLRTPLAIRWPGNTHAGTVRGEFVSHVDIMPTLLDAAGITAPHMYGSSLVPLLRGGTVSDWRDDVASAYDGDGNTFYTMRMIRTHAGKLIFHAYGEHELYDLTADPCELTNCFGNPGYAGLTGNLAGRLVQHLERTGDTAAKIVKREFGIT